ncbi:triple tyrosine motif-containing protein [Tenacibaculum sp. 1_MG-2023]|uniref:helix-turn-helix and ligand-binding sensor domain-containing protein n=1 Tax=Tenacibaculum sp. 1_MG-2023 TaxID=3062653 RepID=UPI0026E1582D|nr:LuxR C-terminal-related transcriptional regulator [Tenacibaculum sp. 1_MG-2023]MDO6601058.1 LuxR C-terminal-related transcriptional regulator [Tenacibaculum sp. 1_MG-2023]
MHLGILVSNAQELPPINNYTPVDYNGETQNWAISQSKEGYIYAANNKGLLEFNGANWQLYPTPNETIMRSVKVYKDKIFTGFYMDFGYWQKNEFGSLKYTSIAEKSTIPLLEDEQFWSIIQVEDWILFQSLQRIYLYNLNTKEFKVIKSNTTITKMLKVDDTIYFQQINKGVFKIEKGGAKLLSDDKVFKNGNIVSIFKKGNQLLFLTENKGFYLLDKNKVIPWNIPSKKRILGKTIYSGIQLSNKDFALGTISNGFIYLTSEGDFKYEINQKNGLNNNTILSLFEDVEGNVWLGLDNGIDCVDVSSPLKIYKDIDGDIGTVYASILFNNKLYLGTNQGLFYKEYESQDNFTFIKNTQGQVWCIKEIEGQLFCGHNTGTFIIQDNNKADKISNIQGTWDIKKINKGTLIQGNYKGLHILTKQNNVWKYKNKIEGFDNSSRYFELLDSNMIFVNHEYKGVFKLNVDSSYRKVKTVVKDTTAQKGIHSGIVKYKDEILYANKKGVFKYDEVLNEFKKDTILSALFLEKNYTSGKLIVAKEFNKLWAFTKNGINYSAPGKLSSKPTIKYNFLSENLRKGATGYENISFLKNNKYLIGISKGYIILNEDKNEEIKNFPIKITSIKAYSLNNIQKKLNLKISASLENNINNVEISYATPVYSKFKEVLYQYKLEGQNNIWSNWSRKTNVLFENLKYGDYTFTTRSKIADKLSSKVATYKFSIKKPWYLSNLMFIIYCLSLIVLYYIIHTMYTSYYKKQQEEVLKSKQKEFELTTLENEKQLMRIRNDKLRADIESKNRELASSTMSIIKKNEFLNSIKKELTIAGETASKNVIKIIDNNLNNTDDWQLFKEAFNNADKDFIKKIKLKHTVLTPNDLRLCAYLRLNLSSKEIAPLLNISPRSVEIKRYRLRKKMNLPHETNLTNYILEI